MSDKKLLASYYSACDVLLFPSVFDNASIVILEAAANSLPVATIEGSCSAERLENEVSGFVWANDEKIWADEILKILAAPEKAQRAAAGALSRVYVGWEDIAEEYFNLYKKLL